MVLSLNGWNQLNGWKFKKKEIGKSGRIIERNVKVKSWSRSLI